MNTWKAFAHEQDGVFTHVGPRRYVDMFCSKRRVVVVELEEHSGGNYYAWLEKDFDLPSMVWPTQAQFSMCFPYGVEVEQERGRGRALRLKITAL